MRNAAAGMTMVLALLAAAHGGVAEAAVDTDSFSAEAELLLDDFHADDDQQTGFTLDALGDGSHGLSSENASHTLDYDFAASAGGQNALLSMEANGGGGEQTSAHASMDVSFETTRAMRYRFSPYVIPLPQQGFSASLNDVTVAGHYDRLEADLVGGNYFTDADAWPAEGMLPAGLHTLSFTFDGAGYRGAAWNNEASVTLELTPVPEPTTALLLGAAAVGLLRRRRA